MLLSPTIRESIGLDLKNSIIVIDESHNIGLSAEKAFSHKLTFKNFYKAKQLLTKDK